MNVDTPSPITHVSLCAGYGGIDLGLKRAIPALRTIAFSEIEAFACANLVAKMEAGLLDPAPLWTDLKTFPWADFHGCVDILSGGYPCQPFSAAGKRLGAEDPRHLWPHISAGIAVMRPSCCFFENVEGHISLGLPDVIEDLEGLGYRTTWGIFSASEVGAPHQRKRVFILAHRHGERGQLPNWWRVAAEQVPVGDGEAWRDGVADTGSDQQLPRPRRDLEHDAIQPAQCHDGSRHSAAAMADPQAGQQDADNQRAHGQTCCQAWPSRPGEQQFWWEPPRVIVDDAARMRSREPADGRGQEASGADASGEARMADTQGSQRWITSTTDNSGRWIEEAGGSNGESNERQTQPALGRDADGPADWLDDAELFTTCDNRTDELRLLGNGVVPATAERAFRTLVSELMEHANQ